MSNKLKTNNHNKNKTSKKQIELWKKAVVIIIALALVVTFVVGAVEFSIINDNSYQSETTQVSEDASNDDVTLQVTEYAQVFDADGTQLVYAEDYDGERKEATISTEQPDSEHLVLTLNTTGLDDVDYDVTWVYSDDDMTWTPIEGETGMSYTMVVPDDIIAEYYSAEINIKSDTEEESTTTYSPETETK